MSAFDIILGLGPILALLGVVIFFVAKHAASDPHRLNKRDPSPHSFGGAWSHDTFHKDGDHPDDWNRNKQGPKSKKPRRRKTTSRKT